MFCFGKISMKVDNYRNVDFLNDFKKTLFEESAGLFLLEILWESRIE